MIVLDTSAISDFLRKREGRSAVALELRRLVTAGGEPLAVPGIVLQEVLSGIRERVQFERIGRELESFEVIRAEENDHLLAAEIVNACRRSGIAASTVDALIAATTIRRGAKLFTTDRDFARMTPLCGLELFAPRRT